MKAVIYARVSSDEQQKEGFSIPAQIELLESYAKKNNIEVVKIYTSLKLLELTQ
jgi:DNA invertase Pin-like site-specific DNA recombinase